MGESSTNSPALTTRLFLCGLRSYRSMLEVFASRRLRQSAGTWGPYVLLHVYFLLGQNFYTDVAVPFFHQQLSASVFVYLAYNALLFSGLYQYFNVLLSNPGYVMIKPIQQPIELSNTVAITATPDKDNNLVASTAAGEDSETSQLINVDLENNQDIAPAQSPAKLPQKNVTNFCAHCDSWRAPRSKHCYHCGKCVVKFDHHCPFFQNCIGGRNHRLFWWFLATETVLLSWTFMMFLNIILSVDQTLEEKPWMYLYIIVGLVFAGFLILSVGGLTGFHAYLAITNQTTFEIVTNMSRRHGHHGGSSSIFNEGFVRNVVNFCTGHLKTEWLYAFPPPVNAIQYNNSNVSQNHVNEPECVHHDHGGIRPRFFVKSVAVTDDSNMEPIHVKSELVIPVVQSELDD
eukprot:TRINITY_DN367_c0_g1_i1.p1 TRINITY_DN367_c0_g1~~TRINITY_DN367_c0_g1_i1.p1  ORF type:complete len:415 (-),score=77.55 TRINITY_DN367_c0_g1_i1:37-1242(-)